MFAILRLFTMERSNLSISEIEKELEYPKSTIFRILNSLIKENFIVQHPDTQRYSIGVEFFRLGSIFQSNLDIRGTSLPIMEELAESSLETVELNIIDGIERLCIEKIDSPQPVRNFVRIGDRHPLHLGASGKCLLAFTDTKNQEELLSEIRQEYKVDVPKIRSELKLIQQNGYSLTKGERVPGSFAVSAPLYGESGRLVGSITLAGPVQRFSKESEEDLVRMVTESATNISKSFGNFITNV